jgi:hypothetical protein
MVWILLGALAVPLWLVVGVLAAGLWSRRAFKRTPGVFPAKVRVAAGQVAPFKASWPRTHGHARWVHDVVLVHRGLALLRTQALPVASVEGPLVSRMPYEVTDLGPLPVVLTLTLDSGATVDLAARVEDSEAVVGPYAVALLNSRGPGLRRRADGGTR